MIWYGECWQAATPLECFDGRETEAQAMNEPQISDAEAVKKTPEILVIDDDADVGELISAVAQGMGFRCVVTNNAATFLASITQDTSLIFVDLVMPEIDGIELLRLLSQRGCDVDIVLMSGVGKRVLMTAVELAQNLGLIIVGHIQKPFRLAELEQILKTPLHQKGVPLRQKSAIVIPDADLRRAIARDEFVLHYQPQIEVTTREVVGVEALVRWQHPERGLIYPDSFIARAEQTRLIDQLGWIVVRRGFAELSEYMVDGGLVPALSINASVRSLRDLKFPDRVVALAAKFGVQPERVMFEITESGLIDELSSMLDVLTRLRMKQVRLSVDDFGTGYAMMQQLRHVPATELKIDKSFVQNMHSNDNDRVMVKKTIEIGHELGMKVVAEGVETAEQLEYLSGQKCDIAQGYLFSHPLPLGALVSWLNDARAGLTGHSSDNVKG
jgi:EAL domain-containing protein (putative c-di-GMP-specific phosphodiesterase class I)/FixJ family two-component response regulator